MTNYCEYKEGKVYDPAHLRPFSLDLAKRGHPLATKIGEDVRLLREQCEDFYAYDLYCTFPIPKQWMSVLDNVHQIENNLRIAPLDVKDGKPLHVGDVIEIANGMSFAIKNAENWVKTIVASPKGKERIIDMSTIKWRWPVEVKA
jgi:hypothetical protein